MDLQTATDIIPIRPSLTYNSKLLCMGSCFADRMGQKLRENKFQAMVNPLGIAFNPVSLFKLIEIGLDQSSIQPLKHPRLAYSFSFDLHSQLSFRSEEDFSQNLDKLKAQFIPHLQQLDFLILTFGTAHVYERVDDGRLVNNCHKYPANFFSRRMLSPDEIHEAFFQTIKPIWEMRPELQVILTVSPIRHVRDGLTSNSLSKSILRYACSSITQKESRVSYFPSYEIMLDELRDYRFYKEDMIHPNELAEGIIWQRFIENFLDEASFENYNKWGKLRRELAHKPLHEWSEEYFIFLQKLKIKLENLSKNALNLDSELQKVSESLDHWQIKYGTMQKK
ncbi:MAG: GSCFA domain-containing protein [Bacteroidia bacterium]|nr:GSCFA domain-containing protein [Bacteroidia bacterium]